MARDLIDLHIHVGGAVAPHVLWSIAHQQGFKLPVKTYFEFVELITATPDKVGGLDDYLKILHTVTEKIQSSPMAIERSVCAPHRLSAATSMSVTGATSLFSTNNNRVSKCMSRHVVR